MTWPSALPVLLLAIAWLCGPGLAVGWAAGLRGLTAWGAAPLLSVALIAGSALVAGPLGVPWSPVVPLTATLATTAALLAARRRAPAAPRTGVPHPTGGMRHAGSGCSGRRRGAAAAAAGRARPALRPRRGPSPDTASRHTATRHAASRHAAFRHAASRHVAWRPAGGVPRMVAGCRSLVTGGRPDGAWARRAAAAGSVVAAGFGLVAAVAGMGRPDAVSQTFDASFHYNAVARILATGDASATTIGGLVNSPSFYPAAWHAVVSLVAPHGGIVVASNATALAVALVAWPAGCLLLVRQVVGRSAGAALATPVLATGFGAFPWALVTYGALWPNLLGVALMPAATAALVALAGLARHGTLRRRDGLVLAVVAVPTVALGHPNAVFGLAVVGFWPLALGLARYVGRRVRARRWVTAAVAVAVAGVALAGTYWVMVEWPGLDGIRGYTWDPVETWRSGVFSVLTSSPNGRAAAWALSALVVAGLVGALRRWRTAWLVPAWATTGALYVVAAATTSSPWTGVWYNDSPRLAAMVPVTAAPLAVLGTLALAGLARRALLALRAPSDPAAGAAWVTGATARVTGAAARVAGSGRVAGVERVVRPERVTARWARTVARPAVLTGVAVLLLVVVSGGLYLRPHAEGLAAIYRHPSETLLRPGQEDFLVRVGALLPDDAVVAQNPWTGNALLWTLTGRQVLFPHLTGVWSPEQRVVAERLRDAATDPSVCAAVRSTGTGYVLTGPLTLWSWDPLARTFPGLDDLDGVPGFELMAGDDGAGRLYRITACEPDRAVDS